MSMYEIWSRSFAELTIAQDSCEVVLHKIVSILSSSFMNNFPIVSCHFIYDNTLFTTFSFLFLMFLILFGVSDTLQYSTRNLTFISYTVCEV